MKNLILLGKVVIKLKQILKLLPASENMLSFVELFAMVLRFHCSKKCEKKIQKLGLTEWSKCENHTHFVLFSLIEATKDLKP